MIASSLIGVANSTISEKEITHISLKDVLNDEFTHTIFAEESTAQWCPNCPTAGEALYNIYNSGEYPFYYVALVDDMNPIAKERNQDFSFGIYKIYAFPTVYFDGGNTNFIGRGINVQATENEYSLLIQQEGQRTPKQPISIEQSVKWDGNSKITITLTITNEGNRLYIGRLRSYVTEIESRWLNNIDNPYHFALLDFAINKFIILAPNSPKTITANFDGAADHQGQTYEDITQDNIMVISTISNWLPQFRDGYQNPPYNQQYFAFIVDQTIGSIPE